MFDPKQMETAGKYVQGTIWKWDNKRERIGGVQADNRPVLIVSNNTFNYFSPSVNCVTISSVLKDSPVHVPLNLHTESHVQCEQIYTVAKSELVDFLGIAPPTVLLSVKAKLKFQFDIEDEKDTHFLIGMRKSIDDLRRKVETGSSLHVEQKLDTLLELAEKGFGLPAVEEDFLKLIVDLHKQIEFILNDVKNLKLENKTNHEPLIISDVKPEITLSDEVGVKRKYTEEDKIFIADGRNSLDELIARYGFKDKRAASNKRNHIRTVLSKSNYTAKASKPEKGRDIKYTDADRAFIVDESNSYEALMERYGIDRVTAIKMRSRFKKLIKEAKPTTAAGSRGGRVKYTDEDKRFILDKSNSHEAIMEKYGFRDKSAVYRAKAYLKKISK